MKFEVKDITKSFGEKEVLKGIDFEVESGSALGILGRNGAGKTTTIRIIMKVFNSNSGKVLLDGKPLDPEKVTIGYMPEERGLYPKKKIMEQLMYFAALKGVSKNTAKKNAMELLEKTGMSEYANAKLGTLSKGNQQKIQLVATLICDPDIVILDEPFSGLDPVNAIILKNLVKELIQNQKIVLFSSHQMNYIEEFCNDIVILNQGKVVLSGKIKQIKKNTTRDKIIVKTEDVLEVNRYIKETCPELINNIKTEEENIVIKFKDENDKKKIFKAISDCPSDIDGMKVYEPSLNDIFVKYTEGAI